MHRKNTYPTQQPEQNLLIKLGLLSVVCTVVSPSDSTIMWRMPSLLWALGEQNYRGPLLLGAYIMDVTQDSGTQGRTVG